MGGVNGMAWQKGRKAYLLRLDDAAVSRFVFGADVDGCALAVSGPRKLAAISCDANAQGHCSRLIVLDIGVEEEEESEEEEDDSDDDQDSDLRQQIVDID